MSQIFIGYDEYGIDGVDEEFIRFIFDVTLGATTRKMDSEAGIVITDDAQMKKLNQRYLGKNHATNVLSFSNMPMDKCCKVNLGINYLGDVYVSYPVLQQEAKKLKISYKERFAQLFIHGLLHLLGFDHDQPSEAKAMEALEDQIVQLVV